jgi:glutaminase
VGPNATGRRFNSVAAIEDRPDGRTNPMVNPGAIATTSMAPGESTEEKWRARRAPALSPNGGKSHNE